MENLNRYMLLIMTVPSKQSVTNFMPLAYPSKTLIKCTSSFADSA